MSGEFRRRVRGGGVGVGRCCSSSHELPDLVTVARPNWEFSERMTSSCRCFKSFNRTNYNKLNILHCHISMYISTRQTSTSISTYIYSLCICESTKFTLRTDLHILVCGIGFLRDLLWFFLYHVSLFTHFDLHLDFPFFLFVIKIKRS